MFSESAYQRNVEMKARLESRKRDRAADIKEETKELGNLQENCLETLKTVTATICTPQNVERILSTFSRTQRSDPQFVTYNSTTNTMYRLTTRMPPPYNITKRLSEFFICNDAWYDAWNQLCILRDQRIDSDAKQDSVPAKEIIERVIDSSIENIYCHCFDDFVHYILIAMVLRDHDKTFAIRSCVAQLFSTFQRLGYATLSFDSYVRPRQKIIPSIANASMLIKWYLALLDLLKSMIYFTDAALSRGTYDFTLNYSTLDYSTLDLQKPITRQVIENQKHEYTRWARSLAAGVNELFAGIRFAKKLHKKMLKEFP